MDEKCFKKKFKKYFGVSGCRSFGIEKKEKDS